jgi:polyphenol oxidase
MTQPYFEPEWPGLPQNVGALSTVRGGGNSKGPYDAPDGSGGFNLGMHVDDDPVAVAANRALLRRYLPGEPGWLNQVHGSVVVDAASAVAAMHPPDADASVSVRPGAVCVIQTADCLPVLFYGKNGSGGNVVGAAHAGWRGLAGGVLENTVLRMKELGASDISAWLGPAIGPDAFEVGRDVLDAFAANDPDAAQAFRRRAGQGAASDKYLADIYHLARRRLARAGVNDVHGGGFCTVSDKERFYSYRRDRITGRMASLIWLK